MGYVKFDMHCHTAEGSVDAKISIDDYINIIKKKRLWWNVSDRP